MLRLPTIAAIGLAAAACGGGPKGTAPPRSNLLIVTLDTTRADRLGCYGSKQVATPNIDRIAREGVLFETALTTMPLTLAAHSSLMTAQFPAAHGVRDNGGYKLSSDRTTLAELLQARGFKTAGFVSAYVLDHRWGIAQGFDEYLDNFDLNKTQTKDMGEIQRRGDETVAAASSWIAAHKGERFFAWVHLYDPHTPYDPPEPYASRYTDPYDGEIAWTDELVGRLLAGLKAERLDRSTVVIVLGDHGESLGEHGEHGHGYFIYRETTEIPLLISVPGGIVGRRVTSTARIVDVAPTALELLGVDASLNGQGRSLLPAMRGAGETATSLGYSESFYARLHYGWSELRGVRSGRWQLIEAPHAELFDLAADPGERSNLAESRPEMLAALRQDLAEIDSATGPAQNGASPIEEDEETLARLASLGYVGTLAAPSDASFKALPDPKERLPVYNLMNHGREQVKGGDNKGARATFEQALGLDPKVIDAWYLIGNSYYKEGDWERAGDAYRKTLALRPDHDYAVIGLADTLVARGRIDDAIVGYQRFLEHDPENGQITYRLAQVLLDAERVEEADRWFERTLKLEPKTARAEVGRAIAAFRRHDLSAANAALDRALAIDASAKFAHYNRALLLEAQSNTDGAATEYRREMELHPDDYKAPFNLGLMLQRGGNLVGAVEAFQAAIAARSSFAGPRFFLAKALYDLGRKQEAEQAARAGLDLEPESPAAPLGHYLLADLLEERGDRAGAQREVARGEALEKKLAGSGKRAIDRAVADDEARKEAP